MNGKRLLAIDDEIEFGTFIRKAGQRLGFEVRFTTDVREFKALYESFDPTVIAVDVVMPDSDGIELVRWLESRNCAARVMIISGFDPRYARAAEIIGNVEKRMSVVRLRKPVSLADLEKALI